MFTNTKNTPIEALERAFPLRVLRYRLRRGSGGAGLATGGEGTGLDRYLAISSRAAAANLAGAAEGGDRVAGTFDAGGNIRYRRSSGRRCGPKGEGTP